MGSHTSILDIVNAPEFRAALRTVVETPVAYSEFLRMPMPEGCDHETIWRVLIAIQKELGYTSKVKPWFKNVGKDEVWYYTPKSALEDLDGLSSIASQTSHLNNYVRRCGTSDSSLLPSVWEEIASLSRRDGMAISERTIREIWMGNLEPANDYERIIKNLSRAFYDVEKLMRHGIFSRAIIAEVHEMLVRGVGELELMPNYYFSIDLSAPELFSSPEYVSDSVDAIVQTAREAESLRAIVIAACEQSLCLWDLPYVPSLRCLTEFLIRRAFYLSKDMPAYSYFPFSSKVEIINRRYTQLHESEYMRYSQEGLNSTWNYAGGIKAYLESAREMLEHIKRLEKQEQQARDNIESLGSLNVRQKTFALTALREPDRLFKVKDYIDLHDVAYATARNDLLGLVNLGVLSMHKDGKAFAFQFAARLRR